MNALQKWVMTSNDGEFNMRGSGKVSDLARHLGITQPAMSKIIKKGTHDHPKHAEAIMKYTKIPASELFPFWADLFKQSKEIEDSLIKLKKQEIQENIKALQAMLDDN